MHTVDIPSKRFPMTAVFTANVPLQKNSTHCQDNTVRPINNMYKVYEATSFSVAVCILTVEDVGMWNIFVQCMLVLYG